MYSHTRWCGKRPRKWLPWGRQTYSLLTRDWEYVISALPFRGQCIIGVKRKTWGRAPGDGVVVQMRERPSVKKVKIGQASAVRHIAAMESEVLRDHLAIVEFLALLQYEDGSPRQPGYVGIWTQGSAWVVRASDKDADAALTCEGRTLDEALSLLAMLLGAEDAPWEPSSQRKRKGQR